MRTWMAALTVALLPLSAQAATPTDARCTVTRNGQTVEGACLFTARKGGSFDVRMTGGAVLPGGGVSLSLDLAAPGRGTLRSGAAPWGAVARSQGDPACWQGKGLSLCARAGDDAPATVRGPDPRHAEAMAARCHMDACRWIDQSAPREIGKGSAAVPGRFVEVTESEASSEHPNGEYPDGPPLGLKWSAPVKVRYFCSLTRPAFQQDDGTWFVLPLPDVAGATEGITTTYLRACHPGADRGDPYELPRKLGYRAAEASAEPYADRDALISAKGKRP